jgi:hypothetical protein
MHFTYCTQFDIDNRSEARNTNVGESDDGIIVQKTKKMMSSKLLDIPVALWR